MEALYTKIQSVPRREHGVFYYQEVACVRKKERKAVVRMVRMWSFLYVKPVGTNINPYLANVENRVSS
jgi:hypothetical protein